MFDEADHQMFGRGPPNIQSTTLMSKKKKRKKKKKRRRSTTLEPLVIVHQMFKRGLKRLLTNLEPLDNNQTSNLQL